MAIDRTLNQWPNVPNWPGQLSRVKDKDLNAPPGAPADGDTYLVGPVGAGLWATHSLAWTRWIATSNVWYFVEASKGMVVYVDDEDLTYVCNGVAWAPL